MPKLEITTEKNSNDIVTIAINGLIDAYSYGQLEAVFNQLLKEQIYKFIVDLSRVDYMSSAGAGVFISTLGIAQENGGNIIFVNPQPLVKDLFDLLGLNHLCPITEDITTAVNTFN